MRVLVACEFSGVVRRAFRALGHDAWSCDLLPAEDSSQFHIQGDVLDHLDDGWDMAICHPECTYLTNAGVKHLYSSVISRRGNRASVFGGERWVELMHARAFFMALYNAPIPKKALENPIPHHHAKLPEYSQLIQPWNFGHGETKATCLWLVNLPLLQPTHRKDDLFCEQEPQERHARCHLESPGPDRWKNRSRTYTGIASAMAQQWGCLKPVPMVR